MTTSFAPDDDAIITTEAAPLHGLSSLRLQLRLVRRNERANFGGHVQ